MSEEVEIICLVRKRTCYVYVRCVFNDVCLASPALREGHRTTQNTKATSGLFPTNNNNTVLIVRRILPHAPSFSQAQPQKSRHLCQTRRRDEASFAVVCHSLLLHCLVGSSFLFIMADQIEQLLVKASQAGK